MKLNNKIEEVKQLFNKLESDDIDIEDRIKYLENTSILIKEIEEKINELESKLHDINI